MIAEALAAPDTSPSDWMQQLREAFRQPSALAAYLGLDPVPPHIEDVFSMRVPRAYAQRMRHGDPNDPLLRQVWPAPAEQATQPGYHDDPVGDLAVVRDGGIIHKYQGRVLLTLTGTCAVHCRYCFRRHFPYADQQVTPARWEQTLATLRADSSIEEVILSGGDPLSLSDTRLAIWMQQLAEIPHLRRLRIHTRQPVVLPDRVDAALCDWLSAFPLPIAIVLHINHAQEIDEQLRQACRRLRATGAQLFNQAVLLAGVNANAASQRALSIALFDAGVVPYYLHMLDRVRGAAHFDVSEETAHKIMTALRNSLPGYLVPRLAREDAGAPSKTLLTG